MPIFRKGDRKIAFIHIPKAAGSSIEMHFTSSGWEMDFYKPCSHPNEPAMHHCVYDELKKMARELDDIPSFCIVRNPYKRMVSEWRWQRNVMRTTRVNFIDFVHRVEVSLKRTLTYWDNHWRPQSDFLNDNIDRVIKIESLDQDFEAFSKEHELGFTEPIPRFGKAKSTKYPRLDFDENTIDRIQRIYANDFRRLGYSKDVPVLR